MLQSYYWTTEAFSPVLFCNPGWCGSHHLEHGFSGGWGRGREWWEWGWGLAPAITSFTQKLHMPHSVHNSWARMTPPNPGGARKWPYHVWEAESQKCFWILLRTVASTKKTSRGNETQVQRHSLHYQHLILIEHLLSEMREIEIPHIWVF